ncbi:MAG: hypothetical protein AB7V16_09650 [Vulcanibacillus sp.]
MVLINYGVLASLIVLILNVLLLTGWFKTIIKNMGKRKTISNYLTLTLLLFFINISITSSWTINVGGFILPLIGTFYLLLKEEEKIYILSSILLLGVIYFLVKEIVYIEPILLIGNDIIQSSIIISIVVIIIGTRIENQIIIALGGILFGDILFNLNHREVLVQIAFGNALTRDIIWLSLLQIIVFKSLIYEISIFLKKLFLILIRIR